jgi:putative oxidoreductase
MAEVHTQKIHERIQYHGSAKLVMLSTIAIIVGLLLLILQMWQTPSNIQLNISAIFFSAVTAVMSILYLHFHNKQRPALFTAFFLISTFSLLIAMRLASIAGWSYTIFVLTIALVLKILNYVITAHNDLRSTKKSHSNIMHNTRYEWQLFFIRMFIGFDLVPHFTEKLFSGSGPRMDDVAAFTQLGISHAYAFVLAAGLIEFAGAFAIGCGFFTRLGAICLFVYLMVASIMGHHFSMGFIWASPGGGWEYPVLWSTLIISFALFGGSGFSLDHVINDQMRLPRWIKFLMGTGN